MKLIFRSFILLLLWQSFLCQGEELLKIDLVEDDILLLDAKVEKHHVGSSIDAYLFNDHILIAIEPLFDGLKLKYKIINKQLKLWKDNEEIIVNLNTTAYKAKEGSAPKDQPLKIWADDGYYQYIELALIAQIFGVTIETDLTSQRVSILTSKKTAFAQKKLQRLEQAEGYLFPIQKLAILNEQRREEHYNSLQSSAEIEQPTITINDQYRLFTPPHGRVTVAADIGEKSFNGTVQLVSDLLYHSSNLTLSKSDNSDLAASLTLRRYKKSPDEHIFGLFDSYALGDISGVSNTLATTVNSGVGMSFNKRPKNYRRRNLETTIIELAPPNWEVDLFHNRRFINKSKVPSDGRLIYESVELFYGLNTFEMKLYGPFGEEEVIIKTVNVKQNPLAQGQVAYFVNALDNKHRLINDQNDDAPYKITNYGGSIDYGVTERWQIGASFSAIDSEDQLFSLKNNLSFNNFLLENEFAIDQGGNYAQLTSLTGSLLEGDNYSFQFESADNQEGELVSTFDNDFSRYNLSYVLPTTAVFTNFSADYYNDNDSKRFSLRNMLSKSFQGITLSHTLAYNESELKATNTESSSASNIVGSLGISGSYNDINISSFIHYDPKASNPILKSSSFDIRKKFTDPYKNNHYIGAKYFPLNDKDYRWQLKYNSTWQRDDFQLTFSSTYNAKSEWGLQLGVQFFLGYDYHHNSFIMDKDLSGGSATLDVHTYLDRQANGAPDVLDYDLPNVEFSGNPRWTNLKSGVDGRTILPGVSGNTEFSFAAQWQEGSATLNNNYVVYTHPGAYVDVNMPFFLITDLAGFVIRQQQGEDIGLKNVTIQLLNNEGEVLRTMDTDEDGYFEFLQLMPDSYKVVISSDYLSEKGLTGQVVGTNITTGGRGGYVELPAFVLRRLNNDSDLDTQAYSTFIIDENNVDALVWSNDEEVNKNYFTLPPKGKVTAKHSLTQDSLTQPVLPVKDAIDAINKVSVEKNTTKVVTKTERQDQSSDKADVFTLSSVINKVEKSKNVLPRLKVKRLQVKEVKSTNTNTKPIIKVNPAEKVIKINETTAINTSSGWVIQFAANKLSINKDAAINQYSAIGQLFLAQKKSAEHKTLNCIISRSFSTKQEAMNARNKVGLQGWVTTIKTYSAISQIN